MLDSDEFVAGTQGEAPIGVDGAGVTGRAASRPGRGT